MWLACTPECKQTHATRSMLSMSTPASAGWPAAAASASGDDGGVSGACDALRAFLSAACGCDASNGSVLVSRWFPEAATAPGADSKTRYGVGMRVREMARPRADVRTDGGVQILEVVIVPSHDKGGVVPLAALRALEQLVHANMPRTSSLVGVEVSATPGETVLRICARHMRADSSLAQLQEALTVAYGRRAVRPRGALDGTSPEVPAEVQQGTCGVVGVAGARTALAAAQSASAPQPSWASRFVNYCLSAVGLGQPNDGARDPKGDGDDNGNSMKGIRSLEADLDAALGNDTAVLDLRASEKQTVVAAMSAVGQYAQYTCGVPAPLIFVQRDSDSGRLWVEWNKYGSFKMRSLVSFVRRGGYASVCGVVVGIVPSADLVGQVHIDTFRASIFFMVPSSGAAAPHPTP